MTFQSLDKESIVAPDSFTQCKQLDTLWVIAFNVVDNTASWNGWNAEKHVETCPKQRVCYMKPIPLPPPTRADAIKETLNQTDSVRRSCDQEYIPYFADLAVAKIAKQIQSQESPTYDNVFIVFGQFHTDCRIFAALGKIIDGSGGSFVLDEANIIATGSLTKFLRGKMYIRRRGHMLLSAVMHGLHIEKFMNSVSIPKDTMEELKRWANKKERRTYTLSGADKFGMCL